MVSRLVREDVRTLIEGVAETAESRGDRLCPDTWNFRRWLGMEARDEGRGSVSEGDER